MGIETNPQYISDLDASLPDATDPLLQADDHLRHIKTVLKQTFPNINGQVTSTQAELDTKAAIVSDGTNATFNTGMDQAKIKTLVGINEPAITTNGSEPSLASGITAAEVKSLLQISLLDAYPVGSIYMSVLSTSPETLFGGTWVPIGAGRVLVGVDSNDDDFDVLEETGGHKTHTLTEDELPAHSHDVLTRAQNRVELFSDAQTTIREFRDNSAGGDGTTEETDTTEDTGNDNAHNNLQPYLVVSMWKRTV